MEEVASVRMINVIVRYQGCVRALNFSVLASISSEPSSTSDTVTVRDVKERIGELEGIPWDLLTLTVDGKAVSNDMCIYLFSLQPSHSHSSSTSVSNNHKSKVVKNIDNKWVHYNDKNIQYITNERELITPLAYCLFYRKKNNLL